MASTRFGEMDLAPQGERTEFGHAKVSIEQDLCDQCTLCTVICPAGILEVVGRKDERRTQVRSSQDNCMGCACCEGICATGAIKVVRSYDFGGYWKQLDRGQLSTPRCF